MNRPPQVPKPPDTTEWLQRHSELTPERVAELAAEFGFTEAEVTSRAANLTEEERTWLAAEEERSRFLRRIGPRLLADPLHTEQAGSLAAFQAQLYERARVASIVLEQAERAYALAVAYLEREALDQERDAVPGQCGPGASLAAHRTGPGGALPLGAGSRRPLPGAVLQLLHQPSLRRLQAAPRRG